MRRRQRRLRWALCLVTASATALFTQSGSGQSADDGSYYYFDGRRIDLDRSEVEAVVGFAPGSGADVATTIRTLAPLATAGSDISAGARTYRLITMPGGKETAALRASATLDIVTRLRASVHVEVATPLYRERSSGARLLPTGEIIVRARAGQTVLDLQTTAEARNLTLDRVLRGSSDEFVLRVAPGGDAVEQARALHESGLVAWAEPNFLHEYRASAVPNDPVFPEQWHLSNSGPGLPGADIDAVGAWDIETGDPSIVIAVLDDGVELTHEDLSPNIFVNPAEIPGNGLDDDQNGFVDDIRGWDFLWNDAIVTPVLDENHGTAVAGIAAARGDNGIGVTGACPRCRILPVKIAGGTQFVPSDRMAEAIRYAASLADVINMSWGSGAPSSAVASALQFASVHGRHGRGAVVVAAAGNRAGGNVEVVAPASVLRPGTHRFRWTYTKDASVSSGADAAWLAAVMFPGGELVRFGGTNVLPAGWQTGGHAPWTVVHDAVRADEGICWTGALRSGNIGHAQTSYVEVVKTVGAGDLLSLQYVSSEPDADGLRLQIDLDNDGTFDLQSGLLDGVPPGGVGYPAAYPQSMAVGASSDFDCRSHYSQFGPELAFLAPGSAGFSNRGIRTTDRTGSAGYGPANYVDDFGGTSSATALASGVAGLLLSRNPTLTPAQVRQILQDTADRIGPVTYVNGRHERYGSGRLNALRALQAVPVPDQHVPPTLLLQPHDAFTPYGQSARLSVVAAGPSLAYQWYRGASGDVSAPVAGATTPVFDTPPVTVPVSYWVRVTNPGGAVDSIAAVLSVSALFDSTWRVPYCAWFAASCDSGWWLVGRGAGEPHPPSALGSVCGDAGSHAPGRIDRVRVSSVNGTELAAGGMVRVEVDTVTSSAPGHLELAFSASPDAPRPIRIADLQAPFTGAYTFVVTYQLPPGAVQTLHARLHRGQNSPERFPLCEPADDRDDLLFNAHDVPSAPRILEHPRSTPNGFPEVHLDVGAVGSAPLAYQWYRGTAGVTSDPIVGATQPRLVLPSCCALGMYWVRVSNALGVVDTNAATVTNPVHMFAVYDASLRAPRCALGAFCSSGDLLAGRGTLRPEPNTPNTLYAMCQDGSAGDRTHESISSLSIQTLDGGLLAPGKRVRIHASVELFSTLHNYLDLYHAPDATNPSWTHVATLQAERIGIGTSLGAEYTLPYGPLQAIRARLRYQGSPGACGPGGPDSYDDHDDLVFATDSPSSLPPSIVTQPSSQVAPQGQPVALIVMAVGPGLTYQWYRGTSGDTSNPLAGETRSALTTVPAAGSAQYWVRVNATSGAIDSATATITVAAGASAVYQSGLGAPACLPWVASCDSMGLLVGRGPLGPEAGAPNTIGALCGDGSAGRFRVDESIDRIRVFTLGGEPFAPGSIVKVEVTAWIFSHASNFIDVYYSPTATNPQWTLAATVRPLSGGLQTFSTGYVLPSGAMQAVRARLRYKGIPAACGSDPYDDHDDLVFAVGGPGSGSFSSTMTTPALAGGLPAMWGVSTQIGVAGPNAGPTPSTQGFVAALSTDAPRAEERALHASAAPASTSDRVVTGSGATPSAGETQAAGASQTSGFGDARLLTLAYPLVPGGRAIAYAEAWFAGSTDASRNARTCLVYLERATNTVRLVDDEGTSLLSGPAGTDGQVANAQCAIDLRSVRVDHEAEGATVSMSVRFSHEYGSAHNVYVQSMAADGARSGWMAQGDTSSAAPARPPGP